MIDSMSHTELNKTSRTSFAHGRIASVTRDSVGPTSVRDIPSTRAFQCGWGTLEIMNGLGESDSRIGQSV
jgi:hypothetical protein